MSEPVTSTRANNALPTRMKRLAILAHRYVGLALVVFLVVAGLTGSVLPFYQELDRALNPDLMESAPPNPGAALMEPFALQERIQQQLPSGQHYREVYFKLEPGHALDTWVEVADDQWQQMFVNPYNGEIQGTREWGNLLEGKRNLIPFVYSLHYSLALEEVGTFLFGVAALLWTVDCFVGAYLTFPAPARNGNGGGQDTSGKPRNASWFRRWMPAWLLRTNKLFSLVFTWHRASGLWLWAFLFVFAWTGVGFNMNGVYEPVMRVMLGMRPSFHDQLPHLEKPYPEPRLSLRDAHETGRRLMAQAAEERGFEITSESSLQYASDHGVFIYAVGSSLDISSDHPGTEVYFSGADGSLVGFDAPTGTAAGNTISNWLFALHMAAVGGLAYRIFVVLMGLAVTVLSVTGVWIWWRKRTKRATARSRTPGVHAPVTHAEDHT